MSGADRAAEQNRGQQNKRERKSMAQQDPAQMTDEELEAAMAEAGIETPEVPKEEEPETPEKPSKPKEEEAESEEKSPEEEAPESEEGEEEGEEGKEPEKKEPEKKPSRREQLRIQDLLRKYPPKQEPSKEKAPAKETKQPEGLLDLDKDLEADEQLKQRLKADRDAAAKAAAEAARGEAGATIAQERTSLLFHTRLEVDAPRVEAKYPVLDKDSDKFKPALAQAINTMYLNSVGYDFDKDTVQNPAIRYSDFVEALFELGDEIGTNKIETTKKEVVKQAAKTGLRPEGGTTKKLNLNKLPGQMTDEELDAIIAQAVPSK